MKGFPLEKTRWWQLKYCLFSSLFGDDSHFDEHFSDGLKPPTRKGWWKKRVVFVDLYDDLFVKFEKSSDDVVGCVFCCLIISKVDGLLWWLLWSLSTSLLSFLVVSFTSFLLFEMLRSCEECLCRFPQVLAAAFVTPRGLSYIAKVETSVFVAPCWGINRISSRGQGGVIIPCHPMLVVWISMVKMGFIIYSWLKQRFIVIFECFGVFFNFFGDH